MISDHQSLFGWIEIENWNCEKGLVTRIWPCCIFGTSTTWISIQGVIQTQDVQLWHKTRLLINVHVCPITSWKTTEQNWTKNTDIYKPSSSLCASTITSGQLNLPSHLADIAGRAYLCNIFSKLLTIARKNHNVLAHNLGMQLQMLRRWKHNRGPIFKVDLEIV